MSRMRETVNFLPQRGATQCLPSNCVLVWKHVLNLVAELSSIKTDKSFFLHPVTISNPRGDVLWSQFYQSNNSKSCILECPLLSPTFPRRQPATLVVIETYFMK